MRRPTTEERAGLQAILERVKRIEASELGADDPVIGAIPWLTDLSETYDRTVGLPPPKDCGHCYFPRHDPLHGRKGRVCELYELTAQPDQRPAELFVAATLPVPVECPFRHGYSAIVGPIL